MAIQRLTPDTQAEAEDATSFAELLPIVTHTIGKSTFVAGLLWEPLPAAHGYMKTVRAYGAQHGLDTAVVNKVSTAMQAGFGVAAKGATPGALSLAAVTASLLGDDFIGVFELAPDTYALVGVMDGAVAPGADRIGDAETIRAEFITLADQYENAGRPFGRTMAPAGFFDGSVRSKPVDLVRLLTPKAGKRAHRLMRIGKSAAGAHPAGKRSPLLWVILAAVGVLIAGGGAYYWKTTKDQAAAARAARQRMAAAQAAAAAAQRQATAKVPPKPWVNQPPVSAFVANCSHQLARLPLAAGGWVLGTAVCHVNGLTATYQRQGTATIAQVEAALSAAIGVKPDIRASGDEVGIAIGFQAPAGASEDLWPASEARTALVSHFQALDVPLKLARAKRPAPPSRRGQPAPTPPPWLTYTVNVSSTPVTAMVTAHHPSLLLDHLDIPGLRLDAITVQRSPQTPFLIWSVKGRLYVER